MVTFKDFKGANNNLNAITDLFPPKKQFLHRDKQVQDIILNLSPIMSNQRAPNFFTFGATGTGKTAILKSQLEDLEKICGEEKISFAWVYVNCAEAASSADCLLKICKQISQAPETIKVGHQWSYATSLFETLLAKKNLVILLDEIDKLIETEGDRLLYYLTRIKDRLQDRNVCVITVSNNINVPSMLSPGTESSFGKLRVEFFNYDALQLKDIILQRVKQASLQVDEEAVALIAGYGAQLHGNARQTLELLKNAYLATVKGAKKITAEVVKETYDRMEHDLFTESVARLPAHQKILLLGIFAKTFKKEEVNTAKVYETYADLCRQLKKSPVSVRRVQQIIKEFRDAGILESATNNRNEKNITIQAPPETFKKVYESLTSTYQEVKLP